MPYFITDKSPDCSGWATIKADGEVIGCHTTKQAAIDQMVAVSIAEDMEPGGERALPNSLKIGDYVSWNSSGGRARGEIVRISRAGKLSVPNTDFEIEATEDDPAALIRIYERVEGGWRGTDTIVGHKFSTLTKIDDLEKAESNSIRALNDELEVGDYVFWDNAGQTMYGEITSVSTFGAVKNPLGGDIVATQGRPLATIQVYTNDNGTLTETDQFVVKGFAPLTKMDYAGQDEMQDEEDLVEDEIELENELERAINQDAPAYMRAAARRGLEYYADGKGGDGLVDKTIREARLMANGQVSDDKWIRTAAWIARHMPDLDSPDADPNSENYPSAGVVAHLLWGSGPSKTKAIAAMEYAQRVAERVKSDEARHLPGKHDQKTHGSGGGGGAATGQGNIGISAEMAADFQGGSAAPHLRQKADGSYEFTPERQALHDKIVSDALAGVPTSADPTYYVMGGGPAAGKSTMLKDSKVSIPSVDKAVQVNPDEVKEKLPEWDRMKGDSSRAAYTHEESSYISKRIQAAAFETKRDVVADGTGDSSVSSMSNKIKKARDANYKVVGNYATVPTSVAIDRANARGAKTGRYVPESVIRSTHSGVSAVLPKIVDQFDEINLFDTTGDLVLLASGKNGKFTVKDKDGYDAFLAKAGE